MEAAGSSPSPRKDDPKRSTRSSSLLAWSVFAIAALSFAYSYFHRASPSAMVSDLMRDFSVGAAVVGNLSAFYFYSYVAIQIPVGLVADRYGERRILVAGTLSFAAGSLLFALADTIVLAYVGRLLIGIGAACTLVPPLQLVGHWFPPHRFALLSGLVLLTGMLGGIFAQGPLAALIGVFGWRHALMAAAAFGVVLAAATWLIVRDRPPSAEARTAPSVSSFAGFKSVFMSGQNLALCVAGFGLCSVLLAFGVLWAPPYLMTAYGLNRPEAAAIASLILFGWGSAAPVQGWLSDYVRRRKPSILISNIGVLTCFSIAVYVPDLPLWAVQGLFLACGFFTGAMVCPFASTREHHPEASGAATAIFNTAVISSGAIMQPLIGWILDLHWDGRMEGGARVYAVADYRTALLVLIGTVGAGVIASMLVRETYARPVSRRTAP